MSGLKSEAVNKTLLVRMYGITETSTTRSPMDCVMVSGTTCDNTPLLVCPVDVVVVVLLALNRTIPPSPINCVV